MTISEEAQDVFEEVGAGRDVILIAAKAIGQQIIEGSKADEQPLSGLVYDVWGLYNEGTPRCRFTSPYENRDIVFSGSFRVDGGSDNYVVRRKTFSQHEMVNLLRDCTQRPA